MPDVRLELRIHIYLLKKRKKRVYIELVEELTAGQRSSLKITSFHPHVNEYVLSWGTLIFHNDGKTKRESTAKISNQTQRDAFSIKPCKTGK